MRGVHGVLSQAAPSGTQVPQVGLQQVSPLLQVLWPQTVLTGYRTRGSHGVVSQPVPSGTQVPQLELQQA
jgi:hypothetical protein